MVRYMRLSQTSYNGGSACYYSSGRVSGGVRCFFFLRISIESIVSFLSNFAPDLGETQEVASLTFKLDRSKAG